MGNLVNIFGGPFDPSSVEQVKEFVPIPSGDYLAVITDSIMKPTKNATGEYLELTHQIIEGPYEGRKVWSRLNLKNTNPNTAMYATRDFDKITKAVGVPAPEDSSELHNIPMIIRVEFIPAGGTSNKDRNEVKGWRQNQSIAAPTISERSAASTGHAPWARPAAA